VQLVGFLIRNLSRCRSHERQTYLFTRSHIITWRVKTTDLLFRSVSPTFSKSNRQHPAYGTHPALSGCSWGLFFYLGKMAGRWRCPFVSHLTLKLLVDQVKLDNSSRPQTFKVWCLPAYSIGVPCKCQLLLSLRHVLYDSDIIQQCFPNKH
jgi:hypothetical protein